LHCSYPKFHLVLHFAWFIDFWGTLSVLDTGRWEAFHKMMKCVWLKTARHTTNLNRNLAVKERQVRAGLRLMWRAGPAKKLPPVGGKARQVGCEILSVSMQSKREGGRTPLGKASYKKVA
jgi:hypothetical protein